MSQTYRDSHGDTNEEQICPEANGDQTLVIAKLMIESVRDCDSQPKRKSHSRRPNAERYPPISDQQSQIDLESDEEEEEYETDVGRR